MSTRGGITRLRRIENFYVYPHVWGWLTDETWMTNNDNTVRRVTMVIRTIYHTYRVPSPIWRISCNDKQPLCVIDICFTSRHWEYNGKESYNLSSLITRFYDIISEILYSWCGLFLLDTWHFPSLLWCQLSYDDFTMTSPRYSLEEATFDCQ